MRQAAPRVLAQAPDSQKWNDPHSGTHKEDWKRKCYAAVDARETTETRARLESMGPSLQLYGSKLKSWNPTPAPYAAYVGEVGRRGARVERYLDGWSGPLGTKLKQLCRGGPTPNTSKGGQTPRVGGGHASMPNVLTRSQGNPATCADEVRQVPGVPSEDRH